METDINMPNLTEIKKILRKEGVVLCCLFGSEARGESHKESDVDIAVLFNLDVKKSDYLEREGQLIALFSEEYPEKEINIVNLNISSPLLKQNVVLEGKLIYAGSEEDRILFQISTLHQYEEYRHLSGISNLILAEKIKSL